MAKQMGKRAIVVGAGIGGMLFARVLADYFEDVTVLERDSLPDNDEPRNGVPQGRHFHGLLAGGCRAMNALLPGLVDDFKAAGAVELVTGLSSRIEMPGYDPFPQRDLGFSSYGLSRPLLELCVRRRVQAIANISWERNSVVERLRHDAGVVTGVALRDGRSLPADFVIDASRRGELTLKAFDEMGYARPRETTIGVDLHYVTALFEIPENAAYDWKVLITHPEPPPGSVKGVLMSTIEGNRWICGVAWQGEGEAPVDRESFIEFTRKLRTQTCYHAIKGATMLGKVARFLFRESCHRHFSELESLPTGLLPVADAICCFNPAHGQGMSVAALEAEAFRKLLETGEGDFYDLPRAFFRRTDEIIEAPWNMAAAPDLAYPETRGERPPNLMQSLKFGAAFTELAARDANAHELMMEIRSLLKPYSALTDDAALMRRILTVLAEMARVEMGARTAVYS
jgi:2-polyprenyl-6-methoxyphenol hydroxylase-like FAD-dependent oxidoreductase